MGPLVTIEPDGILYTRVKPEDVAEIIETTLKSNRVVERLLYVSPTTGQHCHGPAEIPFYKQQRRTVLEAVRTDRPGRHPRIHLITAATAAAARRFAT